MKYLIILLLFPFAASAQVDAAVKAIVKTEVAPLAAKVDSLNNGVQYDTVIVCEVSKPGNIDTLDQPGIYKLTVTGSASAVRLLYVARTTTSLSTRTANPLAWSGSGTWTISVINGRVIVSTTASGIIYKREKY